MDYSPVMPRKATGPQSGSARPPRSLPLLPPSPTGSPQIRADAARNRVAVPAAARAPPARLFAEHGVDAVSMDAIAAAAGVGKGTLFRRFGDKAGLAVALLDEEEGAPHEMGRGRARTP